MLATTIALSALAEARTAQPSDIQSESCGIMGSAHDCMPAMTAVSERESAGPRLALRATRDQLACIRACMGTNGDRLMCTWLCTDTHTLAR